MNRTARIWHRFFLRASLSMAQIFSWIFIFQYFVLISDSLEYATVSLALTYALTQVMTVLLAPLAARGLRHGYRQRMLFAIVTLAAAYAFLASVFVDTGFSPALGISGFAILMGVYRAFYWAPYRVALHAYPDRNPFWIEYVLAVLPVMAGFGLAMGGNAGFILLIVAALFALVSIIPLFSMRDAHEGYAWGYRETFHQLFVGSHRRTTLGSIMHGIEMSLLLIVWPIIVFIILGWSYALLGIVLSIIYIFSILIRSIVRRPFGKFSTPTRALLAASAWIVRLSVVGSVGIILIDTYYYGGSDTSSRGFDMTTLEHAADNTTYVDEYTVLKEVSMAIGRLVMALIVAVLASYMSVTYTFAIVFLLGAIAAASGIFLGARK